MSEHPESIKIKMLQDAGYNNLPPVYHNYLKLVEFVKHMADINTGIYPVRFSIDAEKLLKSIGELE